MKKMFLIGLLLIAGPAIAVTQQVPALFNYQGVLLDEGGNPLPDGISNLKFQISDSAGNVLYEESQDVEIAKGQVSAIVGNGLNPVSGAPTGGIPSGVFDPTDTHYLQVEVDGQRPYDRLEIVATPYSLWADTALRLSDGALTSSMIGKGVIKKEHLDEELMGAIFPDGIPKGMLPKDTVYNEAFTSFRDTVQSNSGAGKVGVTNAFIYSGSQTVQGVLSDLDLAIKKRQEEVEFSKRDYQTKVDNVEKANLSVNGSDAMIGDLKLANGVDVVGFADAGTQEKIRLDSQTGNITTAGNIILNTAGATIDGVDLSAHTDASSAHNVSGDIVGTDSSQIMSNKTLNAPSISGGSITSNITINKDVRIDGVDVSEHNHTGINDGGTLAYYNHSKIPGPVFIKEGWSSDDGFVGIPGSYAWNECSIVTTVARTWNTEGIDAFCTRACWKGDGYRIRCWMDGDENDGTGCENSLNGCELSTGPEQGGGCTAAYMVVCVEWH